MRKEKRDLNKTRGEINGVLNAWFDEGIGFQARYTPEVETATTLVGRQKLKTWGLIVSFPKKYGDPVSNRLRRVWGQIPSFA